MSHDRGCPCGRESYEYEDCKEASCFKRTTKMRDALVFIGRFQPFHNGHKAVIEAARQRLIDVGQWVKPDQWQSRDVSKKPEAVMREVLHFSFQVPITGEALPALRKDIGPNLPWADDHFEERVGGELLCTIE